MFHLQRNADDTGVSGTGVVAEGVIFSDGKVALRWIVGTHKTTVVHDDIDSVIAIHGHHGHTEVIFEDG